MAGTPTLESRRRDALYAELLARARAWLPDWRPRTATADFGAALLQVAARLEAEVTQRLAKVPDKTFRGFLDWLGVRGDPARAARLPVFFRMTAGSDALLAEKGVQLQAQMPPSAGAAPAPVALETQDDVRIVAASLTDLIGADPAADAFYVSQAQPVTPSAPPAGPREWTLKSAADADAVQIQLEPSAGLQPDLVLQEWVTKLEYRIVAASDGIVTIDPPLGTSVSKAGASSASAGGLAAAARFTRVDAFAPFADETRDAQQHALYIGSDSALDIATPADIEIVNGASIPADATWSFWGKRTPTDLDWIDLQRVPTSQALVLKKDGTAIEKVAVDGRTMRWLRATRAAPGSQRPFDVSGIRLRVNCTSGGPCDTKSRKQPGIVIEGIANTTPLVLNEPFFPLGREPRLFDAFYLGSKEAFSKPNAQVCVNFTIDDGFSGALAAVAFTSGSGSEALIVGVGKDAKLHRIRFAEKATDPTTPDVSFLSAGVLEAGGKPLGLSSGQRPGAIMHAGQACVTAAAGDSVWLWRQPSVDGDGSWEPLGRPTAAGLGDPVDTLIVEDGRGGLLVYAVFGSALYRRSVDVAGWEPVADVPASVVRITPVMVSTSKLRPFSDQDGIAYVRKDGALVVGDGKTWDVLEQTVHDHDHGEKRVRVDPTVYPFVLRREAGRVCLAAGEERGESGTRPVAIYLDGAHEAKIGEGAVIGQAIAAIPMPDDRVAALFVADDAGTGRPTLWSPSADTRETGYAPAGVVLDGAPIAIPFADETGSWAIFPGATGELVVTRVARPRDAGNTPVRLVDVALVDSPRDWGAEANLLVDFSPTATSKNVARVTRSRAVPGGGRGVLELDVAHDPAPGTIPVALFRALHPDVRRGTRVDTKRLELAVGDDAATANRSVWVHWGRQDRIVTIESVAPGTATRPPVAVLAQALPAAAGSVDYQVVEPIDGVARVLLRPAMVLDPPRRRAARMVEFETLRPSPQKPLHLFDDLVVLSEPWDRAPTEEERRDAKASDASAFDEWKEFDPPRPRNPKLSWEYWDGNGWWQLKILHDSTENLVKGGFLEFYVPPALAETDVVGRTNHWVRARLVGGDYGEATVTIETTPLNDGSGKTRQTVTRSTDDIRAPYVMSVEIRYQICCPVIPDAIVTVDSGTIRDQSTINRTQDALVEYFVPLATSLARLSPRGRVVAPDGDRANAIPECVDCVTGDAWSASVGDDASDPSAGGGRAIYLGFDGELSGAPINVYFLVDEGDHDGAYPLRADVLGRDGFRPIVVDDQTRGLNESGMLSLIIAEPPLETPLFGRSRAWIRLRPSAKFLDATAWKPVIRGAFVNATWAVAAETQTLERLGSSDGSPNQVVTVARPPLLANSLVLAVRERLGDDELATLVADDPDNVVDADPLPGPWILWRRVDDLADAGPDDRVYALDATTGAITFGDGRHGRIPPVGRDAFLAVRYQTGGGAAANAIAAWSALNLVTPLQGVEEAIAPDGAAGGTDAQDVATTIRFASANLDLRERAVSLRDFELVALQFSRDIAQVRATRTRPGVRVVVVMRGRNPVPPQAVRRELRRALVACSDPALSADGAVVIAGPGLVPVHLQLRLSISSVERSGAVAQSVGDAIRNLLDPATGGLDGTGWKLGDVPSEADIAATLVGIRDLDGVEAIALQRVGEDGTLADVGHIRAGDLVQLGPDGIGFDFSEPAIEAAG